MQIPPLYTSTSTTSTLRPRPDCPGQMRPVTRCLRRWSARLRDALDRRSRLLACVSIVTLLLYLLLSSPRTFAEGGLLGYAIADAPPPPAWSSREERALLTESMQRWHYTSGMCEGCSAYRHRRVISPSSSLCAPDAKTRQDPLLLLLVSTIHRNKRHRCLIRATWGTYTRNNTANVRLLFLFGKDPGGNTTDERLLQAEAATTGDILQDDFNSTYRRGGEIQLIMGYRWVVENCARVTHILKVSDDTYVNVPKVLELIADPTKNVTKDSVWGQCYTDSYPCRDKQHKWYISEQDWPAKMYPKYCAGAYMGVTQDVIRKVLMIAPYIAWSSGNDDVLVGMCAEKLGIATRDIPGFFVWDRTNPCRTKGPKYALHFHGHPPDLLKFFWHRRDCFEDRHDDGGSKTAARTP